MEVADIINALTDGLGEVSEWDSMHTSGENYFIIFANGQKFKVTVESTGE